MLVRAQCEHTKILHFPLYEFYWGTDIMDCVPNWVSPATLSYQRVQWNSLLISINDLQH